LETAPVDSSKEEIMVPGITETECRIAQFRSRELQAEAARQRRSAQVAPIDAGRVGFVETMHRNISALVEHAIGILKVVPGREGTEHAAAPGALAVSK
jgi:hypothetical protein